MQIFFGKRSYFLPLRTTRVFTDFAKFPHIFFCKKYFHASERFEILVGDVNRFRYSKKFEWKEKILLNNILLLNTKLIKKTR